MGGQRGQRSPTHAPGFIVHHLRCWHTAHTFLPPSRATPPGYEEAAAQGLVAGLNAARRAAGQEPVALPRESSYIGTLLDDLVTKDLREPYRMLTSRCVVGCGRGGWAADRQASKGGRRAREAGVQGRQARKGGRRAREAGTQGRQARKGR